MGLEQNVLLIFRMYLVKENSRNLNVVLDILEREHQIKITKQTLINFLKETKI